MKCTIHKDREAEFVCKKCGKPMCEECAIAGKSTDLCPSCSREKLREDYAKIQVKIKKRLAIWLPIIAAVMIISLVIHLFPWGLGIGVIGMFVLLFSLREYNYASLKINKSIQAINYNLSVIKTEEKERQEAKKSNE